MKVYTTLYGDYRRGNEIPAVDVKKCFEAKGLGFHCNPDLFVEVDEHDCYGPAWSHSRTKRKRRISAVEFTDSPGMFARLLF